MFIFNKLTGGKNLIGLLAAASFLAALGGGTILRQSGPSLQTGPFKDTTPIAAFLLGTSIGLAILSLIPRRWIRRITAFMSTGAGITSLLLLVLVVFHAAEKPGPDPNDLHAWAILVLLAIRFSLWFVARSLRTEMAANQKQKLAWVDLAYYSGIVLGLIAWGTGSSGTGGLLDFVIERLGGVSGKLDQATVLTRILVADCCLQLAAGMLDSLWSRTRLGSDELQVSHPTPLTPFDKQWYVRLTAAIVFLTVGTQIIIFVFRGALNNIAPSGPASLAPNVLAAFYVAVSIGAFLFGSLKLRLVWLDDWEQAGFFGSLVVGSRPRRIPFSIFSGTIAVLLIAANLINLVRLEGSQPLSIVTSASLLLCFGSAALLYEIMAAAIFVRIGQKGEELNRKNMVALTFGFMGLGALIGLVLLEGVFVHLKMEGEERVFRAGNLPQIITSHYALLVAVVLCFVLANLAMAWSPRSVKDRLNTP